MSDSILIIIVIAVPIIIGTIASRMIAKTSLEETAKRYNMTVDELKEILKR